MVIVSKGYCNIGEQAAEAQRQFPTLVGTSHLTLWTPENGISLVPERYLIGLAVTFALEDLRFADVLNDCLDAQESRRLVIDVFDLTSVRREDGLAKYFPDWNVIDLPWGVHPIVGKWNYGVFERTWVAGMAMGHLLERVGSTMSVAAIFDSVRPPKPEVFE